MAKLIAQSASVSKKANLEFPVRVFGHATIMAGAQIGRYSYVNRHCFVHGGCRIGRYCCIARDADIGATQPPEETFLSMHSFQFSKLYFESAPNYLDFKRKFSYPKSRTVLGHDVWIGAKVVVGTHVTIGTGAIIGPNSYVNTDVPPYAIVAGNPAQITGYRFAPDVIEKLLASNWWDLEPHEMSQVDFDQVDLALPQIAALLAAKTAPDDTTPKPAGADTPVIKSLRHSMDTAGITDDIADLVLADDVTITAQFDHTKRSDQNILRSKMAYLVEFLRDRDLHALSGNEKRHLQNLFRNKQ